VDVERGSTYAVTRYRSDVLQPVTLSTFGVLTDGDLGRVVVVER
jgi:hypothetical protein